MAKRTQSDDEPYGIDDATAVVSAQPGAPSPSSFSDETVVGASPSRSRSFEHPPERTADIDESTRVVQRTARTNLSDDTVVSRSLKRTSKRVPSSNSVAESRDSPIDESTTANRGKHLSEIDESTVVVRGKQAVEAAEATLVSHVDNENSVIDVGESGDSTVVVRRGATSVVTDDATIVQRRGGDSAQIEDSTFLSVREGHRELVDEATVTGPTSSTAPSPHNVPAGLNGVDSTRTVEEPDVDRGSIDPLNPVTANQASRVQSVRQSQTQARANIDAASVIDSSAHHKTQRTSQEMWEKNERRRKQAKTAIWVMIASMVALGASGALLLTLLLR